VPVHGLSIGDADDGHPVPIVAPGGGETDLTYQRATVETRRRDDLLVDAARISGGAFLPIGLSRPDGLALLFRDQIEPASNGASTRAGASVSSSRVDRSSLFVLASMACLAVTACRRWINRPSRAWNRVAALVAVLLLTASDRPAGTLLDALREGQRATALGELTMALSAYERATQVDPSNVVAHGNAAAVLARLGRPAEALAHLDRALAAGPDLDWRGRLEFARGNALARLGRPRDAIAAYDLCLAISDGRMPFHDDAIVNREAVERLIASASRKGDEEGQGGPAASQSPDDKQRPDPEAGSPSRPRQAETRGPSSPAPTPEPKSLTPEDRLSSAVAAIRSARNRREGAMTSQPIPLSRQDMNNELRDW
jgi:tetratricopeptide (TPR) repeat protein